jgi:hypothetical protein
MPALRELQRCVRDALLGGDQRAAAEVEGDGLTPEARLDIYRHHVVTTLTAALESTFPVVCRLVDRRFFAYAADAFIRDNPPDGPCLFEYGRAFPDFLAAFPACRDQAYLADVARLEWAMNEALHAEDAEPLDPERLAAVAPEDMPRLVLRLDPSLSLLASPWPVDRIWRANQEVAPPDSAVDLGAGSVCLEIRREGGDVVMRALEPADHALRRGLLGRETLERAAAAALAIDPAFDLAAALGNLIAERILVGFAVSN